MDYSTWQDSLYRIWLLIFTTCAISFSFGNHACLVHYRWMEPLLQWLFLVRVTVRDKIPRLANQMWRSAQKWKDQVCVSSSWLLLPSIPCSKLYLWLHCCPFHPWEATCHMNKANSLYSINLILVFTVIWFLKQPVHLHSCHSFLWLFPGVIFVFAEQTCWRKRALRIVFSCYSLNLVLCLFRVPWESVPVWCNF